SAGRSLSAESLGAFDPCIGRARRDERRQSGQDVAPRLLRAPTATVLSRFSCRRPEGTLAAVPPAAAKPGDYLIAMTRLSNSVWASAFDHRPTLPALSIVASLASRCFLSSR